MSNDIEANTIGSRILQRMKEVGISSQDELGAMVGTSQNSISKIIRGITKSSSLIPKIAKALGVSEVWLVYGGIQNGSEKIVSYKPDGDYPASLPSELQRQFSLIPVISWVAAGNFNSYESLPLDEFIRWVPCPFPYREGLFALEVTGISMRNIAGHKPSFEPGDIIFVDSLKEPENKSCVIVTLADECAATFKQLIVEPGDKKYLIALNPVWGEGPIPINGNAIFNGVVTGKYEDI